MPRKTKLKKIKADRRRRLKKQAQPALKKPPSERRQLQKIDISNSLNSTTFIMRDLRKTAVLSLLAIGLEVMLYLVTK
jgi:hypothetical protein